MKYFLVILFIFLTGCWDYQIELPDNYKLVRTHSGSSLITHNSETIVGPSTYGILLAVSNGFILGNLDTEEEVFEVEPIPDRFFIINTDSGVVHSELNHSEYESFLVTYNLLNINLMRPSASSEY